MADKKYATAWQGGGRQGARAGSSDGNAKYGFHNGSSSSKPRTGLDIWRPSLGATNRYVSAGSMGSDSDPDDVFPSPGCNRDYKADPPSHAMLPMPSLPALPALGSAGGFSAGDGDRETASEPSDHGSRGNSDGPEDIQALSLEEAIGPLGLDATAFVKALYEVTRQPPTVGYASADSQIPRFGTGAPLFMRDFYKASTNSGVFEPVSPAVYRRSLFPPTSPQKKRHQSHKVTEVSQHRMSRIDPSGLDLHRHFPPVKSLRLRDDDSNDSKAEIAFLSDLTIHASPAGHGWNCTPRQLVKVLVILNPRTLTDPTRSNLSGFWFTVQSNDIPTVESVETILYERGVKGKVNIFSPSSESYDGMTETYVFCRNAYIAVQKPLLPAYNDEVGIWGACVGGPPEGRRALTKWADDSPAHEFLPRVSIWGT